MIEVEIEIGGKREGIVCLGYREKVEEGGIGLELVEGWKVLERNEKEIIVEVGCGK